MVELHVNCAVATAIPVARAMGMWVGTSGNTGADTAVAAAGADAATARLGHCAVAMGTRTKPETV